MGDIWSFLLQTLTASGAAVLLLVAKAMLRDKLSPRWQFAVWGVLGLVLLLPAGLGGRHVLVNWLFLVELFRSALTGEYGALAHVAAPIPLPALAVPQTAAEWLYAVYVLGAALLLARYVWVYARLRRALRRGRPAENRRVQAVAERYGLPSCPAVEVEGLPSAFICGVFRPVLALPGDRETDEKVILHELLHLKHSDAAWGLVICFFRCVHWCNPLLWYCADQAGNDLEALCDQRVLERLEGEERRDYGRILLEMADERYARAPGTSSMANGGQNIRRRIEAIARFKRYPAGMGLVSVCVALVLAVPLAMGSQASVENRGLAGSAAADLAYGRTVYCTTCAGALDTYAKAVLAQNSAYRAMCAPLAEQNALAEGYLTSPAWTWEDMGLLDEVRAAPEVSGGYQIYNLTQVEENVYQGLLVLGLSNPPEGEEWDSTAASSWLAVQPLQVEKEGERWVVLPLDGFRAVQGDVRVSGNIGLPAWEYQAEAGDFILRIQYQNVSAVDSYEQGSSLFGFYSSFSTTPIPDGEFVTTFNQTVTAEYIGASEDKGRYQSIGAAYRPLWGDESRPAPQMLLESGSGSGGSSNGDGWGQNILDWDWGDTVFLMGGGSSREGILDPPDRYAAAFYLNEKKAAELTLLPVKGGMELD